MAPDTTILADNVRGCLQESTDDNLMYSDYTHMFNQKLYSLNMKCVPKVLEAYEALKIRHESLRLIPPQFNSPLPPLQPAVSGVSDTACEIIVTEIRPPAAKVYTRSYVGISTIVSRPPCASIRVIRLGRFIRF